MCVELLLSFRFDVILWGVLFPSHFRRTSAAPPPLRGISVALPSHFRRTSVTPPPLRRISVALPSHFRRTSVAPPPLRRTSVALPLHFRRTSAVPPHLRRTSVALPPHLRRTSAALPHLRRTSVALPSHLRRASAAPPHLRRFSATFPVVVRVFHCFVSICHSCFDFLVYKCQFFNFDTVSVILLRFCYPHVFAYCRTELLVASVFFVLTWSCGLAMCLEMVQSSELFSCMFAMPSLPWM